MPILKSRKIKNFGFTSNENLLIENATNLLPVECILSHIPINPVFYFLLSKDKSLILELFLAENAQHPWIMSYKNVSSVPFRLLSSDLKFKCLLQSSYWIS